VPQLVPRLRVHEDDDIVHEGMFGGDVRKQRAAIAAAVAVVALLVVTTFWWFSAGPGAKTTVPGSLTGQRVADAQRLLAAEGLRGQPEEVFHATIAKGQVVSTDPPSGGSIEKGGTVTLLVSKGPEQVAVPSLLGLSPEDAERRLREVGLEVGTRGAKFSEDVEKGKVISSSPKAETLVKPGRTVDIVVSKGIEQVEVPNLLGQQRGDVERQLRELGFDVDAEDVDFQFGGPLPGTVTQIDPQPGTKLPKGETVKIGVVTFFGGNNGNGNGNGQGQQTQVPDVRNQPVDQAENALRQAGLNPVRQGGGGVVFNQDPQPGSVVPVGTTVNLFV
jgi:serine/threonine-protein kinase